MPFGAADQTISLLPPSIHSSYPHVTTTSGDQAGENDGDSEVASSIGSRPVEPRVLRLRNRESDMAWYTRANVLMCVKQFVVVVFHFLRVRLGV